MCGVPSDHFCIFGNFYLVPSTSPFADPTFKYFSVQGVLSYQPIYDDFGPLNLSNVFLFCSIVDDHLKHNPDRLVAMNSPPDRRTLTNSVFLIGSYMIMKLGMTPEMVEKSFHQLQDRLISYRDISTGKQNFDLFVRDCWAGLWKAKSLSWVNFENTFDPCEKEKLGCSKGGSIHEIIPGRLIVFRGPKELADGMSWDDIHDGAGHFLYRQFNPDYYVHVLKKMKVKAVLRVCEPEYDAAIWRSDGVAVADLPFPRFDVPSADVVGKFLALMEGLSGPVGLHGEGGLGREGVLAGLLLMKDYGFTAREALGWLRVLRPGSVIGQQQDFLVAKEHVLLHAHRRRRTHHPAILVSSFPVSFHPPPLSLAVAPASPASAPAGRPRPRRASLPPAPCAATMRRLACLLPPALPDALSGDKAAEMAACCYYQARGEGAGGGGSRAASQASTSSRHSRDASSESPPSVSPARSESPPDSGSTSPRASGSQSPPAAASAGGVGRPREGATVEEVEAFMAAAMAQVDRQVRNVQERVRDMQNRGVIPPTSPPLRPAAALQPIPSPFLRPAPATGPYFGLPHAGGGGGSLSMRPGAASPALHPATAAASAARRGSLSSSSPPLLASAAHAGSGRPSSLCSPADRLSSRLEMR